MSGNNFIIGIDEVGRGALAGPVVVAAVALPRNFRFLIYGSRTSVDCIMEVRLPKIELRDSKKLTEKQREEWFVWVKQQIANRKSQIVYAAASVYPKVIDRINITKAANLAATRALKRLITKNKELRTFGLKKVVLDGGLYLNKFLVLSSKFSVRTIVRGDEKYNCIKLASIVAKVRRDCIMARNHKRYPRYGFDEHKGYGTKAHIAALKKRGPCEIHRLTFIKNLC